MNGVAPAVSPSADAVSDLTVPRRLFITGAVCLTALKLASQCYHYYQLYEVDRLVRYITELQDEDQEAAAAAAAAATATSSSLLSHAAESASATPPNLPLSLRSHLAFKLPETTHIAEDAVRTTAPAAAAGVSTPKRDGGHDSPPRSRRASSAAAGAVQDDTGDTTAAASFVSSAVPLSYSAVVITMASTPSARTVSCGLSTSMATRDVANGGCGSAAESPTAAAQPRDDLLCRVVSTAHDAAGAELANGGSSGGGCATSLHRVHTPTAAATNGSATSIAAPHLPCSSAAEAHSSVQAARTPRVHLFIQPRWALAPSVSPPCTKWETFLRLYRVPYVVHEVHVLRSDPPQAHATDVPQQLQQESHASRTASTSSRQSRRHAERAADCASAVDNRSHDDAADAEAAESSAAEQEALYGGSFAAVLTQTSKTQRAMLRAERVLRRVVPPALLPSHLRTQYPIPFLVVDGQVLRGSFADVVAQLTARGLVHPTWTPRECVSPGPRRGAPQPELGGAAEAGAGDAAATSASVSLLSTEEQRAVGQAVERTAEYTLRILYDVGLVLEGTSVFSHYVAQVWRGQRYWDPFQVRGWLVHAWLALPFLSVLTDDAEHGLAAHELGGLTREQLYESLQSDLMSLEQLLVASASPAPSRRPSAQAARSHVSDCLQDGATPSPSPVPPSPEKRFRPGERGVGAAVGAVDEEAEPVEVSYLLGAEPGPQDCALYAYLLPILRLTPHDIACIDNPNFDYIYESAVFHAFVQRMTAEAFPDLEVLLHPPRPASVALQLIELGWMGVKACAAEAVAATRSGAAYCWRGAVRWVMTQPLVRHLRHLHASATRQFRRGGRAVHAGVQAGAAATASALRDSRQVLVDCAMYSRTLRRRGILDDLTDVDGDDGITPTSSTIVTRAAAGAAAVAAATSSTAALSAYGGDRKRSNSSEVVSVEELDVVSPVYGATPLPSSPSGGAGRSGDVLRVVPLAAPTELHVKAAPPPAHRATPSERRDETAEPQSRASPPPQPPTPALPIAAAALLPSVEASAVHAEAPRHAAPPGSTAIAPAETLSTDHPTLSPRPQRSRTAGTSAGREDSAQSGRGTACATVVECSVPAAEERAAEGEQEGPEPAVQHDAVAEASTARRSASSHSVEVSQDPAASTPSQARSALPLSVAAGTAPPSPALAATQPAPASPPHETRPEKDEKGPAELVYVLPSNSHDEWAESPTPAAAMDVTREPSPAPEAAAREREEDDEGQEGLGADVHGPSRADAADSTDAASVTPSRDSSSVDRLPACSPSPRVLPSHSPPRQQSLPSASPPRKRRAAASPPFASSTARLSATPPPSQPPPVIATPSVRRSICVDDGRPHPNWRVKPQRSSASVESRLRRASPVQPKSAKASPVRSARSGSSPAGSAVPAERATLIRKQRPSTASGEMS